MTHLSRRLTLLLLLLGLVVIAPFVPRLMMRIGPGRLMQLATLLAAITLVTLGLFQNVYLWFPLRFLLGASAAMLWSASMPCLIPDDDDPNPNQDQNANQKANPKRDIGWFLPMSGLKERIYC